MHYQAALCREFGAALSIEEVGCPAPVGEFVAVGIGAVAICHSDITFMDGGWGGDLPLLVGHEAAGEISAIGERVQGYAKGDRVIVTLINHCGTCACCAQGQPCFCTDPVENPAVIRDRHGGPVTRAMHCGAFGQKVVVHASQLIKIPDSLPFDIAALLGCGVITGIGAAVNVARIKPGENVVVFGAGGVGLNAIQGARLAGARRIMAIDRVPQKLEDARAFGATHTGLAGPDCLATCKEALSGRADVVMVSVGSPAVYEEAPRYLGRLGRLVMLGMTKTGVRVPFDPLIIADLGQTLLGTKMGNVVPSRDIPWIIDLYTQGRVQLDALISKRWRFDQINEAIEDTRSGQARRNVIVFE